MIQISSTQSTSFCNTSPTQLPLPLTMHQMVYSQSKNSVYIFGGLYVESISNQLSKNVDVYKWDLSQANSGFTQVTTNGPYLLSDVNNAILVNNKVYFFGIYDESFSPPYQMYTYDIDTEAFIDATSIAQPSYGTYFGCISSNNTHIFMVGGNIRIPQSQYPNYLQIYSINDNSWYSEEFVLYPINNGWENQACVFVDNSLYVFGGYVGGTFQYYYQRISGIYKYDYINGWSNVGDQYENIYKQYAPYYPDESVIFVVGGNKRDTYSKHVDVFDVNTNTMGYGLEMLYELSSPPSTIINKKLYIFGGEISYSRGVLAIQICDLTNWRSYIEDRATTAAGTETSGGSTWCTTTAEGIYHDIDWNTCDNAKWTYNSDYDLPSTVIHSSGKTIGTMPDSNEMYLFETQFVYKYDTVNKEWMITDAYSDKTVDVGSTYMTYYQSTSIVTNDGVIYLSPINYGLNSYSNYQTIWTYQPLTSLWNGYKYSSFVSGLGSYTRTTPCSAYIKSRNEFIVSSIDNGFLSDGNTKAPSKTYGYNLNSNQWTQYSLSLYGHSYPGCTVVENHPILNGHSALYVFEGQNSKIEYLDINDNKWYNGGITSYDMQRPYHTTAIYIDGTYSILIIGGFALVGGSKLSRVDEYDILSNTYIDGITVGIPQLNYGSSEFALGILSQSDGGKTLIVLDENSAQTLTISNKTSWFTTTSETTTTTSETTTTTSETTTTTSDNIFSNHSNQYKIFINITIVFGIIFSHILSSILN